MSPGADVTDAAVGRAGCGSEPRGGQAAAAFRRLCLLAAVERRQVSLCLTFSRPLALSRSYSADDGRALVEFRLPPPPLWHPHSPRCLEETADNGGRCSLLKVPVAHLASPAATGFSSLCPGQQAAEAAKVSRVLTAQITSQNTIINFQNRLLRMLQPGRNRRVGYSYH